jgi:hypothetical protein
MFISQYVYASQTYIYMYNLNINDRGEDAISQLHGLFRWPYMYIYIYICTQM